MILLMNVILWVGLEQVSDEGNTEIAQSRLRHPSCVLPTV